MMDVGTCPVCNGSGRVAAGDYKYKSVIAGYDQETDTLPCTNCGGQYMYGSPKGQVRLRADGTPCAHEYESKTVGRCLTQYTCKHCGDSYHIDSGD
jgi:hypothetical protein